MKMFNNYLVCEEVENQSTSTSSIGFTTASTDRIITVKVVQSEEEDVPVGSTIKIFSTAGLAEKIGLIIKRQDIICKV